MSAEFLVMSRVMIRMSIGVILSTALKGASRWLTDLCTYHHGCRCGSTSTPTAASKSDFRNVWKIAKNFNFFKTCLLLCEATKSRPLAGTVTFWTWFPLFYRTKKPSLTDFKSDFTEFLSSMSTLRRSKNCHNMTLVRKKVDFSKNIFPLGNKYC